MGAEQSGRVRVHAADAESVTIVFTNAELMLVCNAVDGVCNVVQELDNDDEFARRMGATRAEVETVLSGIQAAICDEWD